LAAGLVGWEVVALPSLPDGVAALHGFEQVAIVLLNIGGASIHDATVAEEVAKLQQSLPEVPFAFVAENDAYEAIVAALRVGARGYLPTSLPSAVVAEAVRLMCAGGTYAPLRSLLPMARPEHATLDAPRQTDYSARQLQILQCLRRGLANKQIAYELGMSEGTVKVHVRKLMRKAQAQNRTQLVMQTMAMPLKY
jgi:DNA-binding NarL/FixJ family response regulator